MADAGVLFQLAIADRNSLYLGSSVGIAVAECLPEHVGHEPHDTTRIVREANIKELVRRVGEIRR